MASYRAIWKLRSIALLLNLTVIAPAFAQEEVAATLPEGVRTVWDVDKAYRETTRTRERICLNGLWRWQPAQTSNDNLPTNNWGYFKVPGSWPGITDYMQKDFQTVHAHPNWKGERLGSFAAACYARTRSLPREWD